MSQVRCDRCHEEGVGRVLIRFGDAELELYLCITHQQEVLKNSRPVACSPTPPSRRIGASRD